MKKALAAVLAAVASLLLLAVRHLEDRPAPPAADTAPATTARPAPPVTPAAEDQRSEANPALRSMRDHELDAQIARVVDSMDRVKRPPRGIAQGGRRGGSRGLFENAEGRLPAQPRGYYAETDVWPARGGGRGAQRLVFGRGGEVYYTRDHYRTFTRIR